MSDSKSSGPGDSGPGSEEELARQFEQLRADVAEMSRLLKRVGLEKADGLREDLESRVGDFEDMGRRHAEELSKSAASLEAEVAAHIREKPLQSLILAAVIGFVFGLLSRRG